MKIKEKFLNKVADMLSIYQTPKYDFVTSLGVMGEVKGILTTYDCTYTEELKNREQKGFISIDKLLERELGDSNYNDIYFCEQDKVVCIKNNSKTHYVEPVHEYFDNAYEAIYLVCDTTDSYESLKSYIAQNSKYHQFLKVTNEIPYKKSFDKLFNKIDKENTEDKTLKVEEKNKNEEKINQIELEGKIFNIGKEFQKKNGELARFIDIVQEYEFNGKIRENVLTVLLSEDNLKDSEQFLRLNQNVKVVGKLNSYTNKNKQLKTIINCTNIEKMSKDIIQNKER